MHSRGEKLFPGSNHVVRQRGVPTIKHFFYIHVLSTIRQCRVIYYDDLKKTFLRDMKRENHQLKQVFQFGTVASRN